MQDMQDMQVDDAARDADAFGAEPWELEARDDDDPAMLRPDPQTISEFMLGMTSKTAAVWRSEVPNLATFGELMVASARMGRFGSLVNGLPPEDAAQAFGDLFHRVMRVQVGRDESSLAIHVELPFFRSQMSGWDGKVERERKLTGSERVELADAVLTWAKQMGATHFAVEQERDGNSRQIVYGGAGERPRSVTAYWH
jgi:hypothetical protein